MALGGDRALHVPLEVGDIALGSHDEIDANESSDRLLANDVLAVG